MFAIEVIVLFCLWHLNHSEAKEQVKELSDKLSTSEEKLNSALETLTQNKNVAEEKQREMPSKFLLHISCGTVCPSS